MFDWGVVVCGKRDLSEAASWRLLIVGIGTLGLERYRCEIRLCII